MDFMKVFDQTVREIKREVNLKVLKVPEIEQKGINLAVKVAIDNPKAIEVLDATDDEPWGPHGTALAEIAQATKKFSECQMVMNVLWTRLPETGKNWRYVYKSLAVIEYLVAHGSERALDEIIEHTYQISSLTSFEYVEPNGKDVGINVRKKAENIVALLNNKEKIQEVRDKASANRDKYFGLSSSGVTFKSSSASLNSSSNFQRGDRYGGFGSDGNSSNDSYKKKDRYGEDKVDQSTFKSKKGSSDYGSKVQTTVSASGSNTPKRVGKPDKTSSSPSQRAATSSSKYEEDFDDFDPRGTSSTKPSTGNSDQVDLFGQNLIGDLLDAPTPVPADDSTVTSHPTEVDLFADADFVSAKPQSKAGINVDLFASQPSSSPVTSSTIDFFAAPDPVVQPDVRSSKPVQINTTMVDPFAAVPLNNFDSSDPFGAFVSPADPTSVPNGSATSDGNQQSPNKLHNLEAKPTPKKDNFQVSSGIWADSLSRGLIDLNIAAPTKVNLADVGIVGGLTDGSDVKEKGPTTFYMGRAMGQGTKLGQSGFTSTATSADDFFSSHENYQFGSFQK